jgi:hypothetical protein
MADAQEWVWVKDLSSGYRYDIPAVWLDEGGSYEGVQVLAAKPRHFGVNPRATKYPADVDVAGDPDDPGPIQTTAASAAGADAASAAASNQE